MIYFLPFHFFTFSPLPVVFAEGAIDNLRHLRLRVLLSHSVCDAPVDIRYFEALNTIVGDVGHKIYVVNIELALLLAFGIARRLPFLTTVSRIILRWV